MLQDYFKPVKVLSQEVSIAPEYRGKLEQFGMRASMRRKGNCYDNAPMESFWEVLKNELVHHRKYKTRQETILEITEYIEIFYNRQRKQVRLGISHLLPLSSSITENRRRHELNGVHY